MCALTQELAGVGIEDTLMGRAAIATYEVLARGQTVLIGSGLQSANWESIIRTGQLVLNAGDTVKVVFYALTAGQTVGWSAMGYLVRTA